MIKEKLIEQYRAYLLARSQSLNYINVMRTFLNFLEENKLEPMDITQETLTVFFTKNERYSISTRNQFIKGGRSFYDFLGLHDSAWHRMKLMQVAYRIPDFLTVQDVEEAKKYLKTYHSKKYTIAKIEALISFLFATGVRKAELLNLKRADIDIENNKAKVFGKGKRERYIYFDNKTKAELIDYFSAEEEKTNAFNLTLGKINYIPKLLSKYLGKKVYLHLFRHSSARNMIMKDVPINIVQKILGHSSLQTTMRYTEPNEKMIADKYKEKMR